jgi:hypothetical protein
MSIFMVMSVVVVIFAVMILVIDNILEKHQVPLHVRKRVSRTTIFFAVLVLLIQVLLFTYRFLSQ